MARIGSNGCPRHIAPRSPCARSMCVDRERQVASSRRNRTRGRRHVIATRSRRLANRNFAVAYPDRARATDRIGIRCHPIRDLSFTLAACRRRQRYPRCLRRRTPRAITLDDDRDGSYPSSGVERRGRRGRRRLAAAGCCRRGRGDAGRRGAAAGDRQREDRCRGKRSNDIEECRSRRIKHGNPAN